MRKTNNRTNRANNNVLTAHEYFERVRNGETAPGTNPELKKKHKKVVMTAHEYFESKNVSRETLTESKPNKETAKPDKKTLNKERREKERVTFEKVLNAVCKKKSRDFVSYENVTGLYRLYSVDAKTNKRKCIARIKLQKDIYVLIREQLAKALNYDYDLINYNLPASIHFEHTEIKERLTEIYNAIETA